MFGWFVSRKKYDKAVKEIGEFRDAISKWQEYSKNQRLEITRLLAVNRKLEAENVRLRHVVGTYQAMKADVIQRLDEDLRQQIDDVERQLFYYETKADDPPNT